MSDSIFSLNWIWVCVCVCVCVCLYVWLYLGKVLLSLFFIAAVLEHNLHDFCSVTLCQSLGLYLSLPSTPVPLWHFFPPSTGVSKLLSYIKKSSKKQKTKKLFSFQAVETVFSSHRKPLTFKKENVCWVLYLYWEKQDTFQDIFFSCSFFVLFLESIEMYLMVKTKNSD